MKRKKSWVTELAIVTTLVGVFETGSQALTGSSLLPEPWGAGILAILGGATILLRARAKQLQAQEAADKAAPTA